MRYTLSVLTAPYLLALSQAAWSANLDRDFLQRAHTTALALPDTDRACTCTCAKGLLQQLQASVALADARRHLPLNPVLRAACTVLQQDYATAFSAHTLAHPMTEAHWRSLPAAHSWVQPRMDLEPEMVQRWLAPWLRESESA